MILSKRAGVFVELLGIFLIMGIFFLLLFKYYGQPESVYEANYVNPSYEELEREALVLGSPYYASNETAKNVFVLNYHVVSKSEPKDDYDISYDQFKEVMFALKKQGYQTITLEEFYSFMRGERELPDKSFLLTFDDAARMSYYNTDPILRALNYTAVMYVITGFSLEGPDKVYYLNATELEEMQKTGRWEIESHGHNSHYRLQINPQGDRAPALTNKLWIADQRRLETNEEYYARVHSDLTTAKKMLEERFSKNITSFALPFGDFGHRASNYPDAHDVLYGLTTDLYKVVFYQFAPAKSTDYRANYPESNKESYVAVRLSVDALRTADSLLEEVEASRALELPYFEDYSNSQRWTRLTGEAIVGNGSITFINKTDEDIFMSYLDGSYLWRDYTYKMQVNSNTAEEVQLLARFKGSGDYVACSFSRDGVGILRVKDPQHTYIHYYEGEMESISDGTELGIAVHGNIATCIRNGMEVLSGEVSDMPAHGGIGIRTEEFTRRDKIFSFGNVRVN